jgi:hypothetical protein
MVSMVTVDSAAHNVQLNNEKDKFVWELTTSGQFTIKSMYLDLLNDIRKYIWNMKVPLKVNFFIWFLH